MTLLHSAVRSAFHPPRVLFSARTFSSSPSRSKQRLVILGSGWGGYEVLRGIDKKRWSPFVPHLFNRIRADIPSREDVTLISPTNTFNFTPLLASCAVGTLEFRCAIEPASVLIFGIFIGTSTLLILTGQKILSSSGTSRISSFFARMSNLFAIRLDCLPGLV